MLWTLLAALAFLALLLGILVIVGAIGLFLEAELPATPPPGGLVGKLFRELVILFGLKDAYGAFLLGATCELVGVGLLLLSAVRLALTVAGK